MKKLFALVLTLLLLMPVAFAEDIDLSGLSFEELAALRDRIQYEMMTRDEWQEVTVPHGVWEVGVDIPAGTWTIRCTPNTAGILGYAHVLIGSKLNSTKTDVDFEWGDTELMLKDPATTNEYVTFAETATVTLTEGQYLFIDYSRGSLIFTPYTGKPSLGFK